MWAALGDGEEAPGNVSGGVHVADAKLSRPGWSTGPRGWHGHLTRGRSGDGDDVDAGEVGADHSFVEASGDGTVAFDAHDDTDVGEAVADLAGAGSSRRAGGTW